MVARGRFKTLGSEGRRSTEVLAIYAIVKAGAKQYRVEPGSRLRVERMALETGARVELDQVLLVAGDGEVHSGDEYVGKTRVIAEVAGHGRGEKIIVFKYKPKVRYRRMKGHRQHYTELLIQEIVTGDGKSSRIEKATPATAGKKASRRKQEPEASEPAGAVASAPGDEREAGAPQTKGKRGASKASPKATAEKAPAAKRKPAQKPAAGTSGRAARSRKKKDQEEDQAPTAS